jgi:predicted ester cyclase
VSKLESAVLESLAAFNAKDFERMGELVTPDFVDHAAPPGEVAPGPAEWVRFMRSLNGAFGLQYEVEDVVVGADRVAVRAVARGVHDSDHLVPATGKPFELETMHFYRVEPDSGRIAEHWAVRDEIALAVTVGALPARR